MSTTTAFQNIKLWSSSSQRKLPSFYVENLKYGGNRKGHSNSIAALGTMMTTTTTTMGNKKYRIRSLSSCYFTTTTASSSSITTSPNTATTTRRSSRNNIGTCMMTSNSLVSPSDNWGNIAILSSIASVSHFLGKSTVVGRLLGPPVTAMAMAFLLGSIGILPSGGSQGQKVLQLLCIQLATPLLLLGVNIQQCRKTCGPLLKSFLLASFGTLLACAVAYPICAPMLESSMGKDGLKVAAALLAKNVGGGLNYVAVCRSLDVSANAVAAGLCVDNIFALVYFPMTSVLASGRMDVSQEDDCVAKENLECIIQDDNGEIQLSTEKVSAVLTIGAIATWLGGLIGGQSGGLPVATVITILFTIIFPRMAQSLNKTGEALGTSLLYLFFATAGAPGLAIADSVKRAFIPLGIFLSLLYGIHGAVLAGFRWFVLWKRRRDGKGHRDNVESNRSSLLPQRLLVASSAAIGGPATAAALAKANNWTSLVGPSLIVGNLGYAMATFMGIGFYILNYSK